jgi:hypothetical protein
MGGRASEVLSLPLANIYKFSEQKVDCATRIDLLEKSPTKFGHTLHPPLPIIPSSSPKVTRYLAHIWITWSINSFTIRSLISVEV